MTFRDTQGNKKLCEVLAPAGSMESLIAAVRCGCDAVYLGGKMLNARRSAANFDGAQLLEAVSYCHVRGVRVYLTLNTLVFQSGLPELKTALAEACAAGVDGIIVQDLAVARFAREWAPTLPLHASTQMSVHDVAGVRMLEGLGFVRVVLARELSRREIADIRGATSLQLECFVHGALCMCVSGQCYLSSVIGGRSGNRGLCAQPCRLPFAAKGQAGDKSYALSSDKSYALSSDKSYALSSDKSYALSLKDLSLIDRARELEALGVTALKIEGRMKRPEYVAAAVTACRRALDGEKLDHAALEAVFSRSGFTAGYYDDRRGAAMFGTRQREDVQSAAPVLKGLAALYKDERQSVPVEFALELRGGLPVTLRACDRDGNTVVVTGACPQAAITAPTDPEKAKNALNKTGNTPYTISNIYTEIDEGLMIPASQLNALRRDALEQLTGLRGAPKPHAFANAELPVAHKYRQKRPPYLRARLARAAQLTGELAASVDEITLPAEEFSRLDELILVGNAGKLMVEIPSVVFDERDKLDEILRRVKQSGVTGAVVGGLGAIGIARDHGLVLHGDYGLNIANTPALEEYGRLGLADATVSLELMLSHIRALGGDIPRGMLAWGHLPLMATRNCPAGDCKTCHRDFPMLTDRLGNEFFVDCAWQVSRLYNCVPLFLADRLDELAVDFLTLYFTRESSAQCAEIAGLYRHGGDWVGPKTRGLYYRKVL